MTVRIGNLLQELKGRFSFLYKERLRGVYLFGSYARDEQDAESDVDVLVVLDRVDHYAAEVDRVGAAIAALSLEYGVSVSPVFIREEDWFQSENPFVLNVRQEAVPA